MAPAILKGWGADEEEEEEEASSKRKYNTSYVLYSILTCCSGIGKRGKSGGRKSRKRARM